ncbi:glycosyltransferase family 2 protein [Clostridium sp. C105KSO13]|uniref:glycosyltransferase family 2 protein n=1 Tax=Clostridium sp. C105KSO13 TaxID=1776045 RepID=UPI0007406840|nr:glycosyltransferase [Clostridium sp. C105KSO13]CUX29283.1 putative glycosyltransferase EpsJ [Clostridium sp. C105KSO13]
MDLIKISIIVPVYNAGIYFKQCINSILDQTYTNYELILIDDGSNDGSREKCLFYAENNNKVKVLLQNRKGVSAARNKGISNAIGDYLMFMDNDDFYKSNDVFFNVVNCLSQTHPDVLIFGRINFWENGENSEKAGSVNRNIINTSSKAEALKYCIETDILTRAVWTKAIKRQLVIDCNILFPEGKRNEDTYFTGKLIQYANTFDWCDSATYMYRKGTGKSQSDQKVSYQIVKDLKDVCIEFITNIKESNESNELKEAYYSYIAYPYAVLMMFSGEIKDNRIKQDAMDIKKYAFVLNYDINPYVKVIKKLYKLLGFSFTIKALNLYDFIKKHKKRNLFLRTVAILAKKFTTRKTTK